MVTSHHAMAAAGPRMMVQARSSETPCFRVRGQRIVVVVMLMMMMLVVVEVEVEVVEVVVEVVIMMPLLMMMKGKDLVETRYQ